MIQLIDVSKTYTRGQESLQAVAPLTLAIPQGKIFGIVGESGAGKSTLLRFINLLERPDQGQVLVKGEDLMNLGPSQLNRARKQIGMVFQHFNLLANLTVRENVALPLDLHPFEDPLPVADILDFVGLSQQADQYPSQLSGGQRQRVGIARALVAKPDILLCDEPTSALDARMTASIIDLLGRVYQAFNMTMVVVTHELDVVRRLSHQVAILESGHLVDILDNTPDFQRQGDISYLEKVKEALALGDHD